MMKLYNPLNSNISIENKLLKINEFKNIIKNTSSDKLDDSECNIINSLINNCDSSDDLISYVIELNPAIKEIINKSLFVFMLLTHRLVELMDINENKYNVLEDKLSQFELTVSSDDTLVHNEKINNYLYLIGCNIKTLKRMINNITTDYVYYLTPQVKGIINIKTIPTNEAAVMEFDNKIISPSRPEGGYSGIDINFQKEPYTYLQVLINEGDRDYFIHNIPQIYEYLLSLKGCYDNIHTKVFVEVINYVFSEVINDITGKEILLDTLGKCDELVSNIIPVGEDSLANIEIIIDKIEEITSAINLYPYGETSLIDEMGLGYMYTMIPNTNDLSCVNPDVLIEYAENNDIMSVLNESIKDRINQRKANKEKEREYKQKRFDEQFKRYDDTYDTRVDIERRRQNDDYDLERDKTRNEYEDTRSDNQQQKQDKYNFKQQKKLDKYNFKQQKKQDKYNDTHSFDQQKKQDKYNDKHSFEQQEKQDNYNDTHSFDQQKKQDKYNFKQQKKQDKYNFKQQKKLDKYEEKKSLKEQKRLDNLEKRRAKRDALRIGINRWKTLELTNDNVGKAVNALKKCAGAVAVGAGSKVLLGVNPILAGSLYLIKKGLKSNDISNKRKIITDMQIQINEIDEKITEADRRNDMDKKLALMKMKTKLEKALNNKDRLGALRD